MKLFFESAKICEICGLKRFFDLAMAGFLLCFLSVPILVKVEFDTYYLKNRSFSLDFKILWMTVVKVVKREGVVH